MTELTFADVQVFGTSYKIAGYSDDAWFQVLANKGVPFEFDLEHLKPLIRPDSVCLDIGSHLGTLTIAMAALAPRGKVYAIEASKFTGEAFKNTLYWNHLDNVFFAQAVVGNGSVVNFVDEPANRSSSHCGLGSSGPRQSVRIDDMDLGGMVDFIKLDVEGSELDVLDGAINTLQRDRPVVMMEFNSLAMIHYREIVPRQALARICEIFPKVGYFKGRTGDLKELGDPDRFLMHNLMNGMVDDLLCRFV